MIEVTGDLIRVETPTLEAELERGRLVSLVRRSDGREFLERGPAGEAAPLELVFAGGDVTPLGGRPGDSATSRRVTGARAEVRFETWNGEGVLAIGEDEETGDLLIEPSACSSRPGLMACRPDPAPEFLPIGHVLTEQRVRAYVNHDCKKCKKMLARYGAQPTPLPRNEFDVWGDDGQDEHRQ